MGFDSSYFLAAQGWILTLTEKKINRSNSNETFPIQTRHHRPRTAVCPN